MSDHARILTSGDGGGAIRIRSGTLTLEQSTVASDNTGERNSTGGVDLQVGFLSIDNGRVSSEALSSGRSGNVTVRADEIVVRNGYGIRSDTQSSRWFSPTRRKYQPAMNPAKTGNSMNAHA